MWHLVTKRCGWAGLWLGSLTVLLAAGLWLGLSSPPQAFGQLPDSGAQFAEMIKELRGIHGKLAEMTGLLREIRDGVQAGGPAPAKPTAGKRP